MKLRNKSVGTSASKKKEQSSIAPLAPKKKPPRRVAAALPSLDEEPPSSAFSNRHVGAMTAFADDPVRGPPLLAPPADVEALNGPNFLTTALLDFLIQKAVPSNLPEDILIGSSNSMSYFETMNRKHVHPANSADVATANVLRRKFQVYSMKEYRFISVSCLQGHFFLVSVLFDLDNPLPFREVLVYDSIRKSGRNSHKLPKNSNAAKYLRSFQQFLATFCGFATSNPAFLLNNPDVILADAKYGKCPQQQNAHDCGIFALATLLHLIDNKGSNVEQAFSQQHIGQLRHAIYQTITTSQQLSWDFYCEYLPVLTRRGISPVETQLEAPVDEVAQLEAPVYEVAQLEAPVDEEAVAVAIAVPVDDNGLLSDEEVFVESAYTDDSDTTSDDSSTVTADPYTPPPILTIDKDMSNPESANATEVLDMTFTEMFIDKNKQYKSLEELNNDVDLYEEITGVRLIIKRSEESSRIYGCGAHIGCSFRAKFGKIRGEEGIILKTLWTKAYHSGVRAPPTAKGRAHKKRIKGRLDPSVDEVAAVKDGKPKAKDVMKAAANKRGIETTYSQAYRAIRRRDEDNWQQHKSSFELIIPYLLKFKDLNDHTTVKYETHGEHLSRIFVCPGIMKSRMRFVRPVMALDAAHLKSQWRGTLYVASVKTACDEIYPVAVAIMQENENADGWNWFLEHLHSAIEILTMDHPNGRVRYKYFSFVSDRQKGLMQALKNVFPNNHSWFCSIHIQRNVERMHGKKVAGYVTPLAKSCSHRQSTRMLKEIAKLSNGALRYLEGIEPSQWRGTAWLDDLGLPPRYGIVTSNMAESSNSMFDRARDGSWLYTLDTILGTMTERISAMRMKNAENQGIVSSVMKQLRDSWEKCAGYKVIEVHDKGDEFNIVRQSTVASEEHKRYNIDVAIRICTCGKWQEFGYPCVDAMAYYRLHAKMSFTRICEDLVDIQYKYATEQELLEVNVVPVCIETIAHDGVTLPPLPCTQRSSGRPKKKRFRKRSKWAHEPENSNIKCSECGLPGHNKRTCEARKHLMEEDQKRTPEERMNEMLELDLS
jgi:hypothetical protein